MVGFKISEFLLNFIFMLNIISNSSYLWEKEKPDCCMTRLSPLKFYSEFFSNIGKWANEIRHCITGLSCHTVTDENAFSRKKRTKFFNIVTHLVLQHLHFQLEVQWVFCTEIPNMTNIYILLLLEDFTEDRSWECSWEFLLKIYCQRKS